MALTKLVRAQSFLPRVTLTAEGPIPYQQSSGTRSSPSDYGSLDLGHFLRPEDTHSYRPGLKRASEATDLQQATSKRARFSIEESPEQEGELQLKKANVARDDDGAAQIRPSHMRSLKLQDTAKVLQFLEDLLDQLKQLGVKKITKRWIEKLCPRKQTRYPYIQSKPEWREKHPGKGQPRVPPWWPPESKCRHVEPDHTTKPGLFCVLSSLTVCKY